MAYCKPCKQCLRSAPICQSTDFLSGEKSKLLTPSRASTSALGIRCVDEGVYSMSSQLQGQDPSERIFLELRSKNDEVKQRAANDLRDLVTLLSRGRKY